MLKKYRKVLFIFRRDLRLTDNLGLNAALQKSEQVLPGFILDSRQLEPHPYQSKPGLQFMLESLEDLQQQLHEVGGTLHSFSGLPQKVIQQLHQEQQIEAVFVNRDFTPFSRQRDNEIQQQCAELGLAYHSYADDLLNQPEQILNSSGMPYQVFTAFYNNARQIPVTRPEKLAVGNWLKLPIQQNDQALEALLKPRQATLTGGRQAVMAILGDLQHCQHYSQQRDFPALMATSGLSAYLKFGCCSIREAYYGFAETLGVDHPLQRQLYWRDFFYHIAWHFPQVFGHAFHSRFDSVKWRNDPDEFHAWQQGCTGFPIVDAGMRELKQTGSMHNRVRMVVASFLVKDLQISWRWGERYFAQHLLDYDPCLNNGNWQWIASTGCDAQPYFRIFNPWLQQQKFDADCVYIKRWIPELRELASSSIHQWHKKNVEISYPAPMVDHALRSQQTKLLFQNLA